MEENPQNSIICNTKCSVQREILPNEETSYYNFKKMQLLQEITALSHKDTSVQTGYAFNWFMSRNDANPTFSQDRNFGGFFYLASRDLHTCIFQLIQNIL